MESENHNIEIEKSDLLSVLDFVKQCQGAYTTKNLDKLISNFYELVSYNALKVSFCDLQNNELQPVFDINLPKQNKTAEKFLNTDKKFYSSNNTNQAKTKSSSTCIPNNTDCTDADAGETVMVVDKKTSYLCHRPVYGETATVMHLESELDDVQSRDRYILTYITPFLHDAITRAASNDKKQTYKFDLTKRQLEILHWAKVGKSNWEIATILGITERTVKFHLGNIYKKLDVLNRYQAIAIAIKESIV